MTSSDSAPSPPADTHILPAEETASLDIAGAEHCDQVADDVKQALRLLTQIDERLSALKHDFSPIAENAAKALDERVKRGLEPLLRCIDMVRELSGEAENHDAALLSNVANELESVLDILQLARFRFSCGDDYNSTSQRALAYQETSNETLHGKIARSKADGYKLGDTVIRSERVYVYKYKASTEEN